MTLVETSSLRVIKAGDTVTSRNGDAIVAEGVGHPPRHAGSSGRIWVVEKEWTGEYFPGVYGCEWYHDVRDQP